MPIESEDLITELRRLLFDWLPRQSWFDARDAEVSDITPIRTETIRRTWPIVMWVPLEVTIGGLPTICQTVLALAPVVPDHVPEGSILGEVPAEDGPVMAYDALADPTAAAAMLGHVSDGIGSTAVERVVDSPWITSIELADNWETTIYRRVQAGAHPDVELTAVLAESGHAMVRPPAAVWRKNRFDLASVRRHVRRGASGTDLATASVTELLRRRCQPRENPFDLAEAMGALGRALAEMHVELAARLGSFEADADSLIDHLVARLPRQLDDAAVERMASAYRRLGHADDLGAFIRVHGNLGLSSIEQTRSGWVFSRFGCSPASELQFEQMPTSPLTDLAGLLHGLAATAETVLANVVDRRDADRAGDLGDLDLYEQAARRELAVLAEAWEERAADALIAGYTSNDAVHRLLPVERISRDALLTLFELELSIRRAVRSQADGPQRLRIPVDRVDELAAAVVRPRW